MKNECKETATTMQNEETMQRTNGSTGRGVRVPANPTAEAIIARLPDRPLVNAREIADALFQTTSRSVVDAIDEGRLHAVKVGGQYRISRAEAARWIRSLGA